METLIIWAFAVFLVLIILIPYLVKMRKAQKEGLIKKKESEELGADKPVAQYPQIDYYRCIGCGACITACPEGGVLGLVSGKASIINGLRCVGHGLCEEACPVSGIKVGLGDIKNRDDIPVLDEKNQTNIPGLYIAGELAGLALIKNAINQGKQVVSAIAQDEGKSSGDQQDLVIVGAGPAGLSASLEAVRSNLSYTLLDQQSAGGTILQYPRKKLVMTKPVEIPMYGWLNKPEYSKEELLDIWQEAGEKYKINLKAGEKLTAVRKIDNYFEIITQNNTYHSSNVILALGRRGTPRKLGIRGEEQSKVMYKLMDAETYQNEKLLVVGGGDSAVEAAVGLASQTGNEVTISYRKAKFFRLKAKNEERINKLIDENKVTVYYNSNILEIDTGHVKLEQEGKITLITNDYVFVFAGGEPPFKLMQEIGIAFGGKMEEDCPGS